MCSVPLLLPLLVYPLTTRYVELALLGEFPRLKRLWLSTEQLASANPNPNPNLSPSPDPDPDPNPDPNPNPNPNINPNPNPNPKADELAAAKDI